MHFVILRQQLALAPIGQQAIVPGALMPGLGAHHHAHMMLSCRDRYRLEGLLHQRAVAGGAAALQCGAVAGQGRLGKDAQIDALRGARGHGLQNRRHVDVDVGADGDLRRGNPKHSRHAASIWR